MAYGALAALDDRPRPGKEPTITPEAKAVGIFGLRQGQGACGYPHEPWPTRLLAAMRASVDLRLARMSRRIWFNAVCKILGQEESSCHKVALRLGTARRRVQQNMAQTLCCRSRCRSPEKEPQPSGQIVEAFAIRAYTRSGNPWRSHDGTGFSCHFQAAMRASFGSEFKRHGTLSLWPGSICRIGEVILSSWSAPQSRSSSAMSVKTSRCRIIRGSTEIES